MAITQRVRAQYERFPYPPVSMWALPRAAQTASVSFERVASLVANAGVTTYSFPNSHAGIRVLVAGGGTLEPLIVAQAHPQARDITVVDLSARSIERARRRMAWYRLHRWYKPRAPRLPPVTWVVDDLNHWRGEHFDYILASNVLHHAADPADLLARLATWLRAGGVMRVVTYPKQSRIWLRQVGHWLQWHGLGPETSRLRGKAQQVIGELPSAHPIRRCYETHRESITSTGIVDAFLHACERPLSPCEWGRAARRAGLVLLGEDQHVLSRSTFLDELLPACRGLDVWSKLEILDCTLELSANPVLWFVKPPTTSQHRAQSSACDLNESGTLAAHEMGPQESLLLTPALSPEQLWAQRPSRVRLPSQLYWELGEGMRRASRMLASAGVDIAQLMETLRAEIGTHYSADGTRLLPGFAASDYDTATLLAAPVPWDQTQWQQLDALSDGDCRLKAHDLAPPAGNLPTQARWLQSRFGTIEPVTELELLWRTTSSR